MLESLRRKSLSYIYNNLTYQIHFEGGLVRCRSNKLTDACSERLSKNPVATFKKRIDTISSYTSGFLIFKMIRCPAGSFFSKHNPSWPGRPKEVHFERPFLLSETLITQNMYLSVMGKNPSYFQESNHKEKDKKLYPFDLRHPVENVSWFDALIFCNELSKLEGLDECYFEPSPGVLTSRSVPWDCDIKKNGYRLPMIEEWEYAAKAGTENAFPGTNVKENLGDYAWFSENSDGSTHPIRFKKPNEWGFYDMAGNVAEWAGDIPRGQGRTSCSNIFGGSWNSGPTDSLLSLVASASQSSEHGNKTTGFRVCRIIV